MDLGVLFGRGRAEVVFEDNFDLESHVAHSLGLVYDQVFLDEVVFGMADRATDHLPRGGGRRWLYRGWMLSEDEYQGLYDAIRDRGDTLVVTPHQLAQAAYLPNWAPLMRGRTPDSIWTESDDPDEAYDAALEALGPPPWILKDHLKSARQNWHGACFVPPGADREAFRRRCEGLLTFRGDRFERGFVVRRFVDLATLPYMTEGRDVPDEHRIFFWNGRAVAQAPYYDIAADPVDLGRFDDLGDVVESPFFTADVARRADGDWTVVELNDGGSSGLPTGLDPWDLYDAILSDP